MKKLLMGIFGLTLLLPLGVFAEEEEEYIHDIGSVEEGSNSTNASVTVGEVEVPVYAVDLWWDSLTFDWIYDSATGSYSWNAQPFCDSDIVPDEYFDPVNFTYYTDENCSIETTEPTEEKEYYIATEKKYSEIHIWDMSKNGRIVPSIKWISEDNYGYVEGKITYTDIVPECTVVNEDYFNEALTWDIGLYTNNSCTTLLEDRNIEYEENKYYGIMKKWINIELEGEELPDSARMAGEGDFWYDEESEQNLTKKRWYELQLELVNKEKPTTTPTAGDTIGTITVTIRAAE